MLKREPGAVYCTKCGAANRQGDAYCIKCGTALMLTMPPPIAPRRNRNPLLAAAVASVLTLVLVVWVAWQIRGRPAPSTVTTPVAGSPAATIAAPRQPGVGWSGPLTTRQWSGLSVLARTVTRPASSPLITDTVAITQLLTGTLVADGKTVRVMGQVTRKTLICNLKPGWPPALLLVVDDGSGALPVLYRGAAEKVETGGQVEVVGAYSAAGGGIVAQSVRQVPSDIGWTSIVSRLAYLPMKVLAVVAAAAVFFDLTMLFLIWRSFRARDVQSWEWKAPGEMR